MYGVNYDSYDNNGRKYFIDTVGIEKKYFYLLWVFRLFKTNFYMYSVPKNKVKKPKIDEYAKAFGPFTGYAAAFIFREPINNFDRIIHGVIQLSDSGYQILIIALGLPLALLFYKLVFGNQYKRDQQAIDEFCTGKYIVKLILTKQAIVTFVFATILALLFLFGILWFILYIPLYESFLIPMMGMSFAWFIFLTFPNSFFRIKFLKVEILETVEINKNAE